MQLLVAVTVDDSEKDDLRHARARGAEQTLCGVDLTTSHRVLEGFLNTKGSLCGSCVDIALLPTAGTGG